MSLKCCAKTWKIGYKLGSRLIFDEHALSVMSVRKQMGKMRKTELVAHTFNLKL